MRPYTIGFQTLDLRYSESAFGISPESAAIGNFPQENNELTSSSKKRTKEKWQNDSTARILGKSARKKVGPSSISD